MHFVPTSDMSAVARYLSDSNLSEGVVVILSEANYYLITTELYYGNTWCMPETDLLAERVLIQYSDAIK
jgi:hypothetical protein